MPDDVTGTLAAVAAGLPGGGESRPGQRAMAEAVERAVENRRHLVVQAGTGTGKSLAYLIPAALSGERVVVATATKALQDQLAHNDLPLVAAAVDRDLSFAVLKGRSNYLCRQRVSEIGGEGEQLALQPAAAEPPDADDPLTPTVAGADDGAAGPDDPAEVGRLGDQVRRLVRWAGDTSTGDRSELEFEPHFRAWAMVSTTARECPGAFRCPSGRDCFAEAARARAAESDVVVVNTHLYGAHLASGGAVLPPHEVVVFDEAHEVEEVMTDSLGVEIGPGRFRALAATARPLVEATGPGGLAARGRGGGGGRPPAPGPPAAGRTTRLPPDPGRCRGPRGGPPFPARTPPRPSPSGWSWVWRRRRRGAAGRRRPPSRAGTPSSTRWWPWPTVGSAA